VNFVSVVRGSIGGAGKGVPGVACHGSAARTDGLLVSGRAAAAGDEGPARAVVGATATSSGVGSGWCRLSGGVPSVRPNPMPYHMVMGRREVLVQLEDDLVERLDQLAAQEGTNRSDLIRRGASAVLNAADDAQADRALQDAYRRIPQDPAIIAAASRLAAATTSEW